MSTWKALNYGFLPEILLITDARLPVERAFLASLELRSTVRGILAELRLEPFDGGCVNERIVNCQRPILPLHGIWDFVSL